MGAKLYSFELFLSSDWFCITFIYWKSFGVLLVLLIDIIGCLILFSLYSIWLTCGSFIPQGGFLAYTNKINSVEIKEVYNMDVKIKELIIKFRDVCGQLG